MTHSFRIAPCILLAGWLARPMAAAAQAEAGTETETETEAETEAETETETEAETETETEAETETGTGTETLDRHDDVMEHVRFEGTLGFLGGWARHADVGLSGSPSLPPGAFDAGALAGAPMAGLRYDLRLVVAFVRMTAGADLAWSLFRAADTARAIDGMGGTQSLSDRGAFLWALRFGLGLEATLDDRVRLFADLLGSVRFLEVQSSLDGVPTTQSASTFAPGLRLGARVRIVDAFFVQLAADGSPLGPWVSGELSVGGAIE
jgi:hypothetical protein